MEALFFLARADEAVGVTSSDDLPSEPVADPLPLRDPSALRVLSEVLGVERPPRPLRDATCRSFPVWDLGAELAIRIGALDAAALDAAATRWHEKSAASLDADPYELSVLLEDVRAAVRAEEGQSLYALLEERAF